MSTNEERLALEERHDWMALIPSLLDRRGFQCTEQTIESARGWMDVGALGNFTSKGFFFKSTEVEESLLESFVEDDYEGALHLTTLDDHDGTPIGFVFWREIPEEEMLEWIDWENLSKKLLGEQQEQISGDNRDEEDSELNEGEGTPNRLMRRSIQLVRNESIRWLEVASKRKSLELQQSKIMETLSHSWVKIELLAVHPDHWKRHIGTLLLACAMYQAYKRGEEHMILHVAGGPENVPAMRLYEKFGFLPVPQGTVFRRPDKDLFVLGNVGQSLKRLCWPALEI